VHLDFIANCLKEPKTQPRYSPIILIDRFSP